MRVAIFTETFLPKVDGIVSILCQVLRRLDEQGHQTILFAPAGAPAEYAGAKVVGVGGFRFPIYPELRVSIPSGRNFDQVRTFQPDLVHAVNPFFLGPFGLNYARRLNLPTVASFHTDVARYAKHYGGGFFAPLLWAYMRKIHNSASLNLCPSSTVLRDLRAHGFERVRWWHRGVDTERFTPGPRDDALRAHLTDGHPNDFLVVYVGRHSPEKRLETIRDSLFRGAGIRLALIGHGPSHAKLKAYYAGTPTVFPGYMQGAELVAAYRAADVFLFPSTTETFGLVALEAMACGTPVIAARTGGVLDIVRDGVNGLYFDPERPEQIGELVRQLQGAPAWRNELAANALAHAQSRPWQSTMDQLIDYYRLAIRTFRQSCSPKLRTLEPV